MCRVRSMTRSHQLADRTCWSERTSDTGWQRSSACVYVCWPVTCWCFCCVDSGFSIDQRTVSAFIGHDIKDFCHVNDIDQLLRHLSEGFCNFLLSRSLQLCLALADADSSVSWHNEITSNYRQAVSWHPTEPLLSEV